MTSAWSFILQENSEKTEPNNRNFETLNCTISIENIDRISRAGIDRFNQMSQKSLRGEICLNETKDKHLLYRKRLLLSISIKMYVWIRSRGFLWLNLFHTSMCEGVRVKAFQFTFVRMLFSNLRWNRKQKTSLPVLYWGQSSSIKRVFRLLHSELTGFHSRTRQKRGLMHKVTFFWTHDQVHRSFIIFDFFIYFFHNRLSPDSSRVRKNSSNS